MWLYLILDKCQGNNCTDFGILKRGKYLESENKKQRLILSAKGNLEIHCGKNIVWSKGNDNADYLFFHNKLGLVLYDKNNKSLWKANDMRRRISAPMILIMQDDGNLVIYDRCRKPYWESRTYEKCKASSGLMYLVFPNF